MRIFPVIKPLSTLLVPCVLLLTCGCYTHQAYSIHSNKLPVSEATIVTNDGKYYRLAYWELGNDGSITGIGVEFQSRSDWSRFERGAPFDGIVASESIALVEAHEVNLLVETVNGKRYRLVSWVLNAEGDLVGRGSVHKSLDDALGPSSPELFQGTLAAKDLQSIETEDFSIPRTILLLTGILAGILAALFLVFLAGYEHG